ncbi:hypothetical protein NBRC10512_005174 [Rhodotorula toruloides]|uniref:TRAF-like zinc finger n=1 Tax=Rhodotorula toruloides (strain NP11) TaxID=1130832 RepID=M7XT93_RHOT1|nr:TRAF-like zinc finger [Rhodotorula toruloides NP11]EMS23448.1 TRAF-like zinc finger [Rhodotorula toruloides NP11]
MGADKERFTTTLPNHLHCRACVEISYPAVIVCSQGHHLCRPCAEKIEESGELECPLCLRPMKLPLRESLLLRRAVEDYEFTCRHEGCDWIGSVVDEDEHADKCEFGPVACSLMQAHLIEECAQWKCIEGCETRTTRANLAQHEAACKASTARILELEATLEAHELKVSALKQALARSKAALEAIRDDNTEIRVPRPVRRRRRPQRMVGLPQEELSNEDKATPSTPDKIPKLEAVPDDTALNPLPSPAATQRLFRTRSSSVSPALPDVKKPRLLSTD